MIRSYKVHGKGINKYDNVRIGLNSRLDAIQATILLAKYDCFINYEIKAVNEVAENYTKRLKDYVITSLIKSNCVSSWAQYTIRTKNKKERNEIQEKLKERQIPSMVYYVKPLHEQKAFNKNAEQKTGLENLVVLCNTVLSLPMHPYLEKEEVLNVSNEIIEILERM